jgi:hypothetical protein
MTVLKAPVMLEGSWDEACEVGNLARKGTRTPPSVVKALYKRLGAVAA